MSDSLKLSERSFASIMSQSLRNQIDELIYQEFAGEQTCKTEFLEELAADIAELYTVDQHEFTEANPRVGEYQQVKLRNIVGAAQWKEFVGFIQGALKGWYMLRKAELLFKRYSEAPPPTEERPENPVDKEAK